MIAALIALLASASPPAPAVRGQADLSRHAHARANLASYIIASDYPPAAVRNHEQGTVRFEVDVTPEGQVAACRVLVSSGSQLLDVGTCQVMIARARFDPARDADGHEVAETVHSSIRWVLPG